MKIYIAALVLMFSNLVFAADNIGAAETANRAPHWSFGVSLSTVSFDPKSAEREYVKDNAWALGLSGNYWKEQTFLSLGMEFYGYSDRAGFSQRTRDNFGDVDNSSSDASAFSGFIAYGPYWTFGADQNNVFYAQGGLNHVFSSDRSIPNCSNCYSEDIDLDAGIFGKLGVFHNSGVFQWGVEAVLYPSSDDFKNALSLVWGIGF